MSSRIEDRLAAALEARADLVTPEDLRPVAVPPVRSRAPRAAVLLLAAAAVSAAVAAPFALHGRTGSAPPPGPAGSPSAVESSQGATPTGPTEPRTIRDLRPVQGPDTVRADLDGDGRRDLVRLTVKPDVGNAPGTVVRVEITGQPGNPMETYLSSARGPERLLQVVELGRDGRQQVLALRQDDGFAALTVVGWDANGDSATLLYPHGRLRLEAGSDARGRESGFYVDEDGLHSWRTVEPVAAAGPTRVEIEEWSWSVRYDLPVDVAQGEGPDATFETQPIHSGLVPTSDGVRCGDISTEAADPC